MASKKKPTHRPFESKTEHGLFTKICDDMIDSPAWQALNRSQRYLYIELKKKYKAKYSDGMLVHDNADNISMPAAEAKKLYSNLCTFRADIDQLIECGFINLVESGWTTRTVNIYGFSDRWKKYGQPNYEVPHQFKRPTRIRSCISTDKKTDKTST